MKIFKSKAKNQMYFFYRLVGQVFDPIFFFQGVLGYFWYLANFLRFVHIKKPHADLKFGVYPMLHDKSKLTPFDAQYFHQQIWAFKKINSTHPQNHTDIGSTYTFSGILSSIVLTTFVDIRPIVTKVENLNIVNGDITKLPFETNTLESLSCLHVIEHIGLGRYGDTVDPEGDLTACAEISRVLKVGGKAYISVPTGRDKVYFNAHRTYSVGTILRYFSDLQLTSLSITDDDGNFIQNPTQEDLNNLNYGCGMYEFTKKTENECVSFVIPAYNCADTVEEAINSIFNDNLVEGDEVIIVNDCSSDNTLAVLEELKRKYPIIKILNNKINIGCPATRNVGIIKASNPYIFNLDSDNILARNSIRGLLSYLRYRKADVAAFSRYYFFQTDPAKYTHVWNFPYSTLTLADSLAGNINPAPEGNFLYTKSSWEKVGKYWEYGKGLHEAYGFSFKQLAEGSLFVVQPNSYLFHRYGHQSLFVRETREKKTSGSEMARKMVFNYKNLLNDDSVKYIEENELWFESLSKNRVKLRSNEVGRNGYVTYNFFGIVLRVVNLYLPKIRIYFNRQEK